MCVICRLDKKDCHLALPYYKMSGLSVTDVVQRKMAMCSFSSGYSQGFLFYLKHSLYEGTVEELSEVHRLYYGKKIHLLYTYSTYSILE